MKPINIVYQLLGECIQISSKVPSNGVFKIASDKKNNRITEFKEFLLMEKNRL
jgi:hypothetical protein